ncbi:KRAB-A domain-containing protein 2-like [Aphelenchoides avenae]|nr:KRAB-A domain-containing protein 2-like [Aphelenchus avenae]
MAGEYPADAVGSSQNSIGDAGSQQSVSRFFNLYDVHAAGKETLVLSATQYNAVVDVILRDQRKEQLSAKERNWTKREIISLCLSLCRECELKKAKVRKSVVEKPLLSEDFNSRCQVDLIDLQSGPDGSYSFLMVYQDHLTKFVLLRALERKMAIASQGSVERANRDVGDMLTMYLKDNNNKIRRNVMGVVVSVEEGCLYKIGTSTGVLDRSYARNQFDPRAQSFLMVDDVPQKEVALRTAAGADSLGGAQGMFHCMCTADCRTARCKCVRAGRACGSRCHKSNTCANKTQDTNDSATEAADENMQPGTSASS